jgi:hypothetical protein
MVPESDHAEALLFKMGGPPFVIIGPVGVLAAVEFHDEARFDAIEINDVRRKRKLPAPFPAGEAAVT